MIDRSDEEIVKLAKESIEHDSIEYILEELDLVLKIIDYYDKHKKLSVKQKFCLCRAIAEVDHHYYEIYGVRPS